MEKPNQTYHQAHVLFEFSPLDARDPIDDKTQRTYQNLKQMIADKSAKECQEIYTKYLSTNAIHNIDELTMGLLVAILVEQDGQQSRYYRDIVTFSKDGLTLFSQHLNTIILERLQKLKDHSVKQCFWIAHQLMKANINHSELICSALIRHSAGGDLSAKNLWLIENLLDLLNENRAWLVNTSVFMVPTMIYTLLRLISDHMAPAHVTLRQRETDFVVGLIREKFLDCLQIGRDFLRLLYGVVKIPEFERLWHDIFHNPKSLHPTFQNPLQLLIARTPRRLIQSRLTIEMERKISFLATQVKFGNQKRYQDWFHKRYLATPESLSLRCDLIRYICTIIHPSNEVLCSDIIPRWAIIGWLLTTCTTSASAASSKLALFLDWLLYDTKMDNIMNIEPAVLVMYYSIKSHPNVTASLLDFLCRIPTNFSPELSEHVRAGIKKSLQQILEKRVVQSLAPLFDNPKHDPALKTLIRENFPEFCADAGHTDNGISSATTSTGPATITYPTVTPNHTIANTAIKAPEIITIDHDKITPSPETQSINSDMVIGKSLPNHDTNHVTSKTTEQTNIQVVEKPEQCGSSSTRDETKAFSWNGIENVNASYSHKQNHDTKNRKSSISSGLVESSKKSKSDNLPTEPRNNISKNPLFVSSQSSEYNFDLGDESSTVNVIYPFMTVPDIDFKESTNQFDEPIRRILEDLNVERSTETRCNLMDKLISTVFDDSDQIINSNTLRDLGHCIAYLVVDDFSRRIFPTPSHTNELLEESLALPFFILCRSAFSKSKTNWTMAPINLVLAVAKFFDATGFLILYFLRVHGLLNQTPVAAGYREFCVSAKRKLSKCLFDDLFMALTYDSEMFCFLLPSVFGEIAVSGSFPVTGNVELIHLVVSAIDPISLQELVCLCLTGTAKIIDKEDVMPLVESSLGWESWEQYYVWKLISAQSVPIENYITILPRLDTKANAEARSCILLNLQKVPQPTVNMVQQVVSCDYVPNDPYISSILRYWSIRTDIKELARMISSLVDSRPPSPQVKRKGQTKATNSLSPRSEKILCHLDSIRTRAPKNKLVAQTEITEMLSQIENLCNENQRKRFAELLSTHPRPSKKQKRRDDRDK